MRRRLGPEEAHNLLRKVGISVPHSVTAADPAAAREAAGTGSFPKVVKAMGLTHKSDHGGVITGLMTPDAVSSAAQRLVDDLGVEALPLLVQDQCDGFELLIGVNREPGVGAVVVVGMGGVHAEVLDDTAKALVPIGPGEAEHLLTSLRGSSLLHGHRGLPVRDLHGACDVIQAVSDLAAECTDIVELDLNPVLVGGEGAGAVAVDARIIVEPAPVACKGPRVTLDRVMRPQHMAVVGVSDDTRKVGTRIYQYLRKHGYVGRLDPVHPIGGAFEGRKRFTSIKDLDKVPDLVCIAVPAAGVLQVAQDAAAIGVGGILVHSSGFAETGPEGAERQRQLTAIAEEHDLRIVGPNSMGIVSPARGMAASLSAALELPALKAGGIALISSSGALGSCLASRIWEDGEGLPAGSGISHWINLGNEADVDISDYLTWLATDSDTTTVGLLIEQVGSAENFISGVRAVLDAGKPVFVYKMARTPLGKAAALSHTGALAGSDAIQDAVLERSGAVTVPDLRTFLDALKLSTLQPLPSGPDVAVLTTSGGACTIIADEVVDTPIQLTAFPPELRRVVEQAVPDFGTVRNPLDLTAQIVSNPSAFRLALRGVLESERFHAVLIQFTTHADPTAEVTADAIVETYKSTNIPLIVSRYGAESLAPRGLARYASAGIPVLDEPARAVAVVAALVKAGRAAISTDRRHV